MDGSNNYIYIPANCTMRFPKVSIDVRIPKQSNYSTIVPVIKYGKKELTYNDLRKFIKDEEYHSVMWDGKTLYVDGLKCNTK